jgi:hypothetical protein
VKSKYQYRIVSYCPHDVHCISRTYSFCRTEI